MPPKKTPGPGRRLVRGPRVTPKGKNQAETDEQSVKIEEVKEEIKPVEENNPSSVSESQTVIKSDDNGLFSAKKEDEVKESVEEYEKGERLDLEDNEPEYEPEEYDEKEQDEVLEEGGEVEEDFNEGEAGEEEVGDMANEEMEDVPEEHEDHEDHGGEEHDEMVDAEDADEMADADEQEHHDVFKERRKRKEFEIFVGGLDKDATEDDLKKVFSEVGEVTEIRLMMNPQTKKNKGFAFLRFATVEQAKRACSELKRPTVNGKQCGVTPSQDSDTLFLGNICKTWTQEALKEKLKHYGVETIEDLTLVEDSNNDGMNRGFAFLEFSSRSDAMYAFKRLQKRDVMFGIDRPAKVSFADSFVDPGDEIMAQVKTVFVDSLPASWDEDRVRELLKKYGDIEKIELARNMPSAKRKDFGFITFDTHEAAVACAKSINNQELGEGENKAKVRARLSRPLQRGKGKHVPYGDFRHGRGSSLGFSRPWSRSDPRSLPVRSGRVARGRLPPIDRGMRRPVSFRDRRPVMAMPPPRPRPAPFSRSFDRRPPVPSYPKSSLKRDYGRHERDELPPRSRAVSDYDSRVPPERRASYRDDYPSRGSDYVEMPRSTSRSSTRRAYDDDGYGQRFERPLPPPPPPSYREGRSRDYDSISGSKRPYSTLDDVPPRYAETGGRQSRSRLDYELGGSSSQYGDAYNERAGRSNVGYGSGRSSISGHDSHGMYSSRQGTSYGEGSYGANDGGAYSSSFASEYASRGADAGGSSYSSLYSGRGLGGGSSYGRGGSGSYY